nr:DUF2029 domain-containing protein [Pseudopedobacter sp.]
MNNLINYIKLNYYKKHFVYYLYIAIAVITSCKQYFTGNYNNYKIYKYSFYHLLHQVSLYDKYPLEHLDTNHYGPVFSLLIAPFALMPDLLGFMFWNIFNGLLLCYGIFSLPIPKKAQGLLTILVAHEALCSMLMCQFNVGLTGLMLLSFSYIISQDEFKSAFSIVLGTLIKLYGVVGLAFFIFSKRKIHLIIYGILITIALLAAPILFSSTQFTYHAYLEWYQSLVTKNTLNLHSDYQDVSFMGMFRRIFKNPDIPNLLFLIPGLILFFIPYLRASQYKHHCFRLLMLASTLIFVVIYSSGSESPTYIIAFTGVSLWFIVQYQNTKKLWVLIVFIFAFIVTSLSPSDLFPSYILHHWIQPYGFKALPCVIVWFVITYQMIFVDFKNFSLKQDHE